MKRYRIELCLEMDGKNPPWTRMYEFEKTFTDFLKTKGVQAERIEYPTDAENYLTLYLSPIEKVPLPQPPKQTSPSKVLKKLQSKESYGK